MVALMKHWAKAWPMLDRMFAILATDPQALERPWRDELRFTIRELNLGLTEIGAPTMVEPPSQPALPSRKAKAVKSPSGIFRATGTTLPVGKTGKVRPIFLSIAD